MSFLCKWEKERSNVCVHRVALGIFDPPLNYHHKMIANHNECDCMDNVPLEWQFFFHSRPYKCRCVICKKKECIHPPCCWSKRFFRLFTVSWVKFIQEVSLQLAIDQLLFSMLQITHFINHRKMPRQLWW